jgi:hypothetical protein
MNPVNHSYFDEKNIFFCPLENDMLDAFSSQKHQKSAQQVFSPIKVRLIS